MAGLKRIVIVGATSSIARHCAHEWLRAGPADLTLVGRDAQRLARVEADLRARSPQSEFRCVQADFLEPSAIEATVADIVGQGAVDIVLIAQGELPDQRDCEKSLPDAHRALSINGLSPVLFAEAFSAHMGHAGQGTLALLGSVAGDRGRKSNYTYGAAKGLVSRYAEGLQHRFAGSAVRVVLIKPGPTDTPMTAQLKAEGAPLASVELVARQAVRAIDRGVAVAYVPGHWRWIMLVIRHIPERFFKKMNL